MATTVQLSEYASNYSRGTIAVNGTDSEVIDLRNMKEYGLFGTLVTSGTMDFLASNGSNGVFTYLLKLDGTRYSTGTIAGVIAIGGDALTFLRPWRYIKLRMSTSQSSGPIFDFVEKT